MLHWSKKFETGHAQIDEQHRKLISYINKLGTLPLATNPSREEVEFILALVDFVEAYTENHFRHEEDCMHRFRCPVHQANKEAHGVFLNFFREFKRRFASQGYHPDMAKELHAAGSSWIEQHILRVDTKLRDCRADT